MIYLCQNCGHRINQRTADGSTWKPDEPLEKICIEPCNVGKYLLYNHKPFCSSECIEITKKNPNIINRDVIPANILERGPNSWKILRKINKKQTITQHYKSA